MRLYYVVNARMPGGRAYAIHVAKTCESFIEAGIEVTLVLPKSKAPKVALREYFSLRSDVRTVRLPAIDWNDRGRIPFFLSSLVFIISSYVYLLREKLAHRLDAIYTIDMDTFSFILLPFVGAPLFAEIHGTKKSTVPSRILFKRARGVIVLNTLVRDDIAALFGTAHDRFIVDPCAVEASWFGDQMSSEEARKKLLLPQDAKIAVYAGRFYDWKGLDIVPEAFRHIPDMQCYIVGGSLELFQSVTKAKEIPKNVHIVGGCDYSEVPVWLAAADVFMVPWPKKQDAFHSYMSPMKIFECLAARRPVVAANDPTITNVVSNQEVLLYEPGNAVDFAQKILQAAAGGPLIEEMVARGFVAAKTHTHSDRAHRIKSFIERQLKA